jgi:hypothetical protein
MSITEKQRDEMLEAAKPLMKWLAENFHPHTTAIVHAAGHRAAGRHCNKRHA